MVAPREVQSRRAAFTVFRTRSLPEEPETQRRLLPVGKRARLNFAAQGCESSCSCGCPAEPSVLPVTKTRPMEGFTLN